MSSSVLNITTYIDEDCEVSSDRSQLLEHRQMRSRMTHQQVSTALKLRGRVALLKGQASRAGEQAHVRKDLHSRVRQHQDRATELNAQAALLRDRVLEARDLPVASAGDTSHAIASISATMMDLTALAWEQTHTVEQIHSQIRDINNSYKESVQELLKFHSSVSNHSNESLVPPPSGISEELRQATVQRLETAAARQELKTLFQEAITRSQDTQEDEERGRRQDFWASVMHSFTLAYMGN